MTGLTQSIHRNAQIRGKQTATICNGRTRTWVELKDRIAKLAAGLQERGIVTGGRIALLGLNSDKYLEAVFAPAWAGGEVVPLNIRWSVTENKYALEDSGATILIFDDIFADQAKELGESIPALKHLIYFGDKETPSWAESHDDIIAQTAPIDDAHRGNDDLFGIFYTGGTTGFPKGVMLSHRSLWASAMSGALESGMNETSRYLHVAPMFHLADTAFSMTTTMVGGTHLFVPAFNADLVVDTIARDKTTHTVLVPSMIKMLLDSPAMDKADTSSLERIIYGASPIPEAVLSEALDKFPHCQFMQGYGQTELSPLATILGPEHHVKGGDKLRSAGRAVSCVQIKIVDDNGDEVPHGTVGQVAVSGPNVMTGYLNMPELTAETLIDGWVHTGDAAYMDEDGFIFIVDRMKDMIITGGENVFSAEVENAVATHPAVSQVAVFGIPSTQWGEQVHADVILRDGQTAGVEEIIEHCKSQIAGYKCPKSIMFRDEPFPLSGAGKILKTELRKPYWSESDRKVA